jgi:NADH-quinone oxidoreductase subunit N
VHGSRFYHGTLGMTVAFPTGWTVQNEPTKVVAITPQKDAFLQLTAVPPPPGVKPQELLAKTMAGAPSYGGEPLTVNGLQGYTADWQQMLVILAVLSLAVGNIVAIAQTNIKRMLAYSTISHMGFVIVGILAGTDTGYSAAMFYAITYAIMTIASFGMILLLSRAGFEADNLDDFRGLNQKSRWYAFVMLITMFSLTGIPPSAGFFGKLFVLQAALDAGYTWLVVYALVMALVGAFYYLRVVKLMYMDAPAGEITLEPRADARWVLSASGIITLALGIVPAPLLDVCARAIAASM